MACRRILKVLALVFLVAVAGYAAGTFASFDLPTDRPAAVILIMLGLPWVLAPVGMAVDQTYWPIAAVGAPIMNLLVLRLVCRRTTA